MNSNEPARTQALKQGPKPAKFPCLPRLALALIFLALMTGVVIR
jgi:hypothetical protein